MYPITIIAQETNFVKALLSNGSGFDKGATVIPTGFPPSRE